LPWHFLDDSEGSSADAQFKKERTDLREVRTFARRQDCDDCAGFLVVDGVISDHVIYFHPSFAGTPNKDMISCEYASFWIFFEEVVIRDTIDWESEESLVSL
jgi:hypothetical protein